MTVLSSDSKVIRWWGGAMFDAVKRDVERTILSRKAGMMTAAALFYFSNAMDAEGEPAASEQTTTEQAPSGGTPAAAGPKADVPIPPVSVEGHRPRPRRPAQATTAAPAPAAARAPAPPPSAAPPASNPALGPTPYQVSNSSITRLPVPLLDTPQTVNVIPQAIIQQQSVSTVEDALRYIPGITFAAGEGGQQGDSPIIRGFVARGDLFRDGIRDPGWYTRDAFSIDRVEVYKGPSAFAFGRGATGGAINYVTRLPTGAQYIESTSTVSTPKGYREVIDASGKKDNVSGRVAALFQD